ncbi:MAG: CDP-alcohol phosphatidyltransferase family protein [Candidatus Nanoarchaeia archaeon]
MKKHKGRKIEEKIYKDIAGMRQVVFKPLVLFLDKVGVTPNMMSYTGVLVMILFAYMLPIDLMVAFYLALIGFLIDLVDGPLARYQKVSSDKGKFIDMVCDSLVFTIFCVGLVYAGLANGLVAVVFVYVMLMDKLLRCIRNGVYYKSKWLFKAVAGFVPNFIVGIIYALFVAYFITGWNFITWGMLWCGIILIIDSVLKYRKILSLR